MNTRSLLQGWIQKLRGQPDSTPPPPIRRAGSVSTDRILRHKHVLIAGNDQQGVDLVSTAIAAGGGAAHSLPSSANDGLVLLLDPRPGVAVAMTLHDQLMPRLSALRPNGKLVLVVPSDASLVLKHAVSNLCWAVADVLGQSGGTANLIIGSPDLAASTVCFLLSDRASYVTGQTLVASPGTAPIDEPATPPVAVVRGACNHDGEVVAMALAAAGFRIALFGDPAHCDKGQDVAHRLGGEASGMIFIACDAHRDAWVQAFETARRLSPRGVIDAVVYCTRHFQSDWRSALGAGLQQTVAFSRCAIPVMAPGGRIIAVTPPMDRGNPLSRAAVTGGLVGLVAKASAEVEPKGIGTNAVIPGWLSLPGQQTSSASPARASTCLGQPGEASDVAAVVEFLVSPASWPLRGQPIHVDGGLARGPMQSMNLKFEPVLLDGH